VRDSSRYERLSYLGVITAIVLGLYLSSRYSYLLFHSLIEIVTIAVAFTLFILTWNSRGYLSNNYLRLLGIGYAFIAVIDLVHTFAYKGMNVFPGYGANLPTQLWIAARYLQADTTSYSDFAIAFWIRNATFPAAAAKLVLTLDGTDDLTVTWTNATTLSISGQTITTASVATTTWRHYALVRSGSTITVYENGVSLGTVTLATARGGTQIIISGTAETGAMEIYDLRVYNATLSAGAIDYLYDDTNDNSGTKVLPLA